MFKTLRTLLTLQSLLAAVQPMLTWPSSFTRITRAVNSRKKWSRNCFSREATDFPSGHKAIPANHASGSPDRKAFFEYVLEMSETRHKRYWARKVSIGKKGAPKELVSHKEVLTWIKNTPLGITYIDKTKADDSVKVLLTVTVFDDL